MVITTSKFFDLTVGPGYVPDWMLWEVCREFIQNALDGADDGFPFDVQRGNNGSVLIRNKGAIMLPKHLIFGETSKFGGNYRGEKGEGAKLAMMAACRIAKAEDREWGCAIHTGEESWYPTLFQSEQYDTEIVRVNVRPRKDDGYLTIEIPHVTLTDWLKIQKRILTFGLQQKLETKNGEILLDEEYKGSLFCKGLWVSELPRPSKYGYNLSNIKLDRDRKMADTYSLKSAITEVLSDLYLQDKILALDLFEFLKDERCVENDALRYYPSYGDKWKETKRKLGNYWKNTFGENVIPISTNSEKVLAATLGQTTIEVCEAIKDFLGEHVLQLSDVKSEKVHAITKVYFHNELTEREQLIVDKAESQARRAVKSYEWDVQIVEFLMDDLNGLCNWKDGLISISRRQTCDYTSFMGTLIHELGHLPGWMDQTKQHMDEVTSIAARILYACNDDVT